MFDEIESDASEFEDQDKMRLLNADIVTLKGNLSLKSLEIGRGSILNVQGDLTVKEKVDVYRDNSRLKVTGDMTINEDMWIRRNATVKVNGSVTFNGRKIDLERHSKLHIENDLRCSNSEVQLCRGSTLNLENGNLRCNILRTSRGSEVMIGNGFLKANEVYVENENDIMTSEIMADTSPNSSVNDSGKYVIEEEEDGNDTEQFDVSKDLEESVDVYEYDPDMDTSDLVVWMEAKIMSESENQEFPFKDFDRVVQQYPGLRNLLGSLNTAQDAERISERNENINLKPYQISKLKKTEEIAKSKDTDGLNRLKRIGEGIDEYSPDAINRPDVDLNPEQNTSDDESDDESDDGFSLFSL